MRLLDASRDSFTAAYDEVVTTIRRATETVTKEIVLTGRPAKNRFSIIEKLRREKAMNLSRMQDIAGCRIVVERIGEQDRVVKLLLAALVRARVVDRRKKPSHGYRAVHVIATALGKTVEIQVRTSLQDLWAQLSEKLADKIDPRIKYGGGDPDVQHTLSLHSGYVADLESWEAEGSEAERQRQGAGSELHERKTELQQSLLKLIETVDATRK